VWVPGAGVTYLKELSDGRVDHHQGSVDQMHHSVLDGDVGVHNFGHHHARRVAVVAHNRVAAHIRCKHKTTKLVNALDYLRGFAYKFHRIM